MLYERQSDKWQKLFGHLDQTWQSELPPHQAFVDGMVDPSLWPSALGTGDSLRGVLHAQAITDLQRATQHLLLHLTTRLEGVLTDAASTGVLSDMTTAVAQAATPQTLASSISQQLVTSTLTSVDSQGGKVASALFAAGLTALSAAGPIGMAAAAIIGSAYAIYTAVQKSKKWTATEKVERARKAFELMPPLQQPGSDTDEWYVRTKIMPALETGSWTRLFAPRFDPRHEWVGAPRNGGYAFAPGERSETKDEFGIDTAVFSGNDNVGFIPGMNRITSVIQVSLDPMGNDVEKWRKSHGRWPIRKAMVQDVGAYYQNSTRLCAVVWKWATAQDASPNLYKLLIGEETAPDEKSLHYQWRSYMSGGIDYIQENGRQWWNATELGLKAGGRVLDPETPEFLFGSAIGCAVASWACFPNKYATTNHPRYMRTDPGYPPETLGVNHGLPNGCVIEPASWPSRADGDDRSCITSLYESHIRRTLREVRDRQLHFLRYSLVCAYVCEGFDAFRDPKLLHLLRQMRSKLLKHRDRHKVRLKDVPEDEMFQGKNWRQALRDSGVRNTFGGAISRLSGATSGSIEPGKNPPPSVLDVGVMPFADVVPPTEWWRRRSVWLGTALAATGGGALALHLARKRRMGR